MVIESACRARPYYASCMHAREVLHLYATVHMHFQSHHLTKHFRNYNTNTVYNFYLFSTSCLSERVDKEVASLNAATPDSVAPSSLFTPLSHPLYGRGDNEVASPNAATPHSYAPSSLSAPFRHPLCYLSPLCSATPCARSPQSL